jgi:hypothetical protein
MARSGDGDRGCSSTAIEEGSTEFFGGYAAKSGCFFPDSVPFTRQCSAHAARIRKEPGSLPPPRRASSNAPSSPRKRRRPRKGDAERVDRRHGSSASPHGLHGSCSLPSNGAGRTRPGSKRPGRENEVGRSSIRAAQAAHGRRALPGGSNRSERRTRTEAAASRGGGFPARGVPARRTCVADIGSAVVAQRSRRFFPPLQAVQVEPAVGGG